MKVVLFLILLTCPLFAQTQADQWRTTKTGWRQVAETLDKPVTYWFYKSFLRRGSDVEVWLKMYEPEKSLKIAKAVPKSKRQYSHQMQFTVFHCGTRRVSMDDSIVYDTLGSILGPGEEAMNRVPIPLDTAIRSCTNISASSVSVTIQCQQ